MKADLSRETFDPTRHFLRVLMQQGRVQVDADWNEQTAIVLHLLQTLARDVVGAFAGPAGALGFDVRVAGRDLRIGPGRYYVDGILCELEPVPDAPGGALSYLGQPDLPLPRDATIPNDTFVAYLDVWERHVTAIDDGRIREVALGGPDTATRAKVVWQVRVATEDASGERLQVGARDDLEAMWPGLVERWQPPDRGALEARSDDPADETDPCITPPESGYRGPENQLYRVEIVDSGPLGEATFAWTRENGSVVSGWDQTGRGVVLADPGRDRKLGFETGQWVQLTDDAHELNGDPGTFARIAEVDGAVLSLEEPTATGPLDAASFRLHPKVRRWDSDGPQPVERPATRDGYIALEDGVLIRFAETGAYRSGDYWLIPARVLGGVEWPADEKGDPVARPPAGIDHHYAPLALFVGENATRIELRYQFAPAAEPVP